MTPDTALPFVDWMQSTQSRMEQTLDRLLPSATSIPARLHEAMRYASLGGGKRVRPLLAFAAGELHTGFVAQHTAALAAGEPDEATRDTVLIAAALGLDKKQVDNRLYQTKRRLRASVTGAEGE